MFVICVEIPHLFGSNPHPVRRLGAMIVAIIQPPLNRLEFQSSPSPKTGRYARSAIVPCTDSISSNPHPVRRLGAIYAYGHRIGRSQFQSSPSPKTGRYSTMFTIIASYDNSSNPHPVRRLGAIMEFYLFKRREGMVPILTQSEDWAL